MNANIRLKTIAEIVGEYDPTTMTAETLTDALVRREDEMAGMLRQAGAMYGLFPQIVAKVISDLQMGEPLDDATKAHIDHQYVELMEAIGRAQRGEGEMPTP